MTRIQRLLPVVGWLPGYDRRWLPGDIAASKRYYEPDLIDPPIDIASDGTIPVPTEPGIGVRIVLDRVDRATLRKVSLDRSTLTAA